MRVSLPGQAPTQKIPNPAGPPAGVMLAKNMTPEANAKRMKGLINFWHLRSLKRQGIKVVTKPSTGKIKRKRLKLRETVAKEAREIQELARKNAAAAMKRMAEIAQTSPNETAAIAAAALLLDRAYGKANQTNTNVNLDANGKATDVSQKELDTRIEKALERIDSLTRGAPKAPASEKPLIDLRQLDRDPDSTPLN
jgi:hypothetical protein